MRNLVRAWLRARAQKRQHLRPDQMLRRTIFQVFATLFITVGVVVYIGTRIIGGAVAVPQGSANILRAASLPDAYTWTSESIHNLALTGGTTRLDALRAALVDSKLDKFQAYTEGVFDDTVFFSSDGTVSAYLTQSAQTEGLPWQKLNDVCHNAPAVPASLVNMPSGDELASAGRTSLVSSHASYAGNPAWAVKFTPNTQIIDEMLWLPFFDRVAKARHTWVLSNEDRAALAAGHFQIEHAVALVSQGRPYTLEQIDIVMKLPSGNWRLLATASRTPVDHPLKNLDFGRTSC